MFELLEQLKKFEIVESYVLPVSKQQVSFTPYKVRDQKYLSTIMSAEESPMSKIWAMLTIIKNCSSVKNPENLCVADAESLFLQIRSNSLGSTLKASYTKDDGEAKEVSFDVKDIKVTNATQANRIVIPKTKFTLILREPLVKDYLESDFTNENLYQKLIKEVHIDTEVYTMTKYVPEEIKAFVDSLPLEVLDHIKKFVENVPSLYFDVKDGEETIRLRGFLNFFPLL